MANTRRIIKGISVITAGSMGGDLTSLVTNLDTIDQLSYQVKWTSTTAVGTFAVQGSNDTITWSDLTFSPVLPAPASNSSNFLINLALLPFTAIRITYTRTSGTGTLDVVMSAKGV